MPLWGWVARRYGIIPVDRTGGAAALRAMMKAAKTARDGRPFDRHLPGRNAGPARSSSRRSSRALPAFTGCSACRSCRSRSTAAGCGRGSGFVKRPGIVTMRFGTPIPPGLTRERGRSRGASRDQHPRHGRSAAGMIPELGLIEGFFGRPWSWRGAERGGTFPGAATAIASSSMRPRPTPSCAGAGRNRIPRPSWKKWPGSDPVPPARRPLRHRSQPVRAASPAGHALAGAARRQARASSTRCRSTISPSCSTTCAATFRTLPSGRRRSSISSPSAAGRTG